MFWSLSWNRLWQVTQDPAYVDGADAQWLGTPVLMCRLLIALSPSRDRKLQSARNDLNDYGDGQLELKD